jgi:protoporphyrinogen oxidase
VALRDALGIKKGNPKTLTDSFLYPRTGPGEFYGRLETKTTNLGAQFEFRKAVTGIHHNGQRITSVTFKNNLDGKHEEIPVNELCLSMPLPAAVRYMNPAPPDEVVAAAKRLSFRDFMVVNIILDKEHIFPDQWIYIHSPEVRVGRIQNYKNWSPAMVPDLKKTSLGMEYFCNEGNDLWSMNDADLINFSVKELEKMGIVSRKHLINGFVVRRKNAYPVYSLDYKKNVQIIRDYFAKFPNLYPMGRSGLFRYNNSDHALLTGIYTARNILGETTCDVWSIDPDA